MAGVLLRHQLPNANVAEDPEETDEEGSSSDDEESNDVGLGDGKSLPSPMMHTTLTISQPGIKRRPRSAVVGLYLGPLLGLAIWLLLLATKPSGMSHGARRLTGTTVWIALWWATEAIPLGVTSLMPLVLFPLLDIQKSSKVVEHYSQSLMWLFFGGFQLAFAVERTGLHRRIALQVMRAVGTRPHRLILGVMLAVGCLSMFLSNTSTTLMILPVVQAMVESFCSDGSPQMAMTAKAMLLGTAYAASSGGIGTIIGTPPNGVLVLMAERFNFDINFSTWFIFAAPLALILMIVIWAYLVLWFGVPCKELPLDHPVCRALDEERKPWSQAEKAILCVFGVTVAAWMSRRYLVKAIGWEKGHFQDETIAIIATIALFLIWARDEHGIRKPLMDWATLLKTPWQILLLFGGGFALASGFQHTGLSHWLGMQVAGVGHLPVWILVALTVTMVTFLTEITSNTATANVLLPILGELACQVGSHPAVLMVPATLACSCAFMLPVATAPNMIVMSTGAITTGDMIKAGFAVNWMCVVLIVAWFYTWGQVVLDYEDLEGHCDGFRSEA